ESACWAVFPSLDAASGAASALAGSELSPVALTLLDARAADACARGRDLPAASGPALLVAFDGLARAVAWQSDETARRLPPTRARTVDRLDGAATAPALEAVREPRRLVAHPIAIPTAGGLPREVG